VRVGEISRIGAFPGRLYLDEAHESVAHGDGKVRPGFQIGQRRFSDEVNGVGG
jgi:hypothetical protein